MSERTLSTHQLLDLIAYQLAGLRKATPAQLDAVHDDLAEAEQLIGPAAEHVERQTEDQHENPRESHAPVQGFGLHFLAGTRNVA